MRYHLSLLLVLLLAALLLPSCAATGFGRKAPVSVASQGPGKAFLWSMATCPETWDKGINPLDTFQPATPYLVRGSTTYWRNVFDPCYH